MSTVTTRSQRPARTLHLAFDLGNRIWKLAFATSVAHAPRLRTISARDLAQLDTEIAAAKARFGLAPDAPVVSCYEAGRDGFWLHRALTARGLTSHVVDSASIRENRRARRTKSDRLDATALARLLVRHHGGERGVWSVLHVPSVDVMTASVAELYGAATLAAILTGMGQDGVIGLRKVKDRGGYVIGQDAATSVVYGMPRAAAQAGLVDRVLPLDEIAPALCELTNTSFARS